MIQSNVVQYHWYPPKFIINKLAPGVTIMPTESLHEQQRIPWKIIPKARYTIHVSTIWIWAMKYWKRFWQVFNFHYFWNFIFYICSRTIFKSRFYYLFENWIIRQINSIVRHVQRLIPMHMAGERTAVIPLNLLNGLKRVKVVTSDEVLATVEDFMPSAGVV